MAEGFRVDLGAFAQPQPFNGFFRGVRENQERRRPHQGCFPVDEGLRLGHAADFVRDKRAFGYFPHLSFAGKKPPLDGRAGGGHFLVAAESVALSLGHASGRFFFLSASLRAALGFGAAG